MPKAGAAHAPAQKKVETPSPRGGVATPQRQDIPRMDSLPGWQHALGNQHILRLLNSHRLQLKSRAPSSDPFELEADRAAELVTERSSTPQIQRKCAGGDNCHCSQCSPEQQGRHTLLSPAPGRVQRQAKEESPGKEAQSRDATVARAPLGGFLVEDDASTLGKGQMKKSVFLAQVEEVVCTTANAELKAAGRSADECPYIAKWLAHYQDQGAAHIECALWRYASEAAQASSAKDYLAVIRRRVRQAVATWAKTGKITGIPPGVPPMPGAGSGSADADKKGSKAGENKTGSAAQEKQEGFGTSLLRTLTGEKKIQFKERTGAAPDRSANHGDPEAIRGQLGAGKRLDSRARARMESAFGQDFSRVRVHTDSHAESLSSRLNARAFTVGSDIAFAPGEYRPGTLVGDALLAHELAHVVQQGAGSKSESPQPGIAEQAYERDANLSAVNAVTSVWAAGAARLGRVGARVAPSLRSGLQLQRCSCKAAKDPAIAAADAPRKCFEEHNTQLSGAETTKIENAITAVAGDNSALSKRFYDYFFDHKVFKASASDMSKWSKSQLAATKPYDDTYLNPSVFDPSYPAEELGALLLHEFSHTRHETSYMGSTDYQEGDSYAIEYFFAERKGVKKRQAEILGIFLRPTSIVMPGQVAALREHFNATYGALQGLYEIIDKGTSSHAKSPFASPAALSRDEARDLAAQLVASTPGNRSARLNDILDYVKKNPSAFPSPI